MCIANDRSKMLSGILNIGKKAVHMSSRQHQLFSINNKHHHHITTMMMMMKIKFNFFVASLPLHQLGTDRNMQTLYDRFDSIRYGLHITFHVFKKGLMPSHFHCFCFRCCRRSLQFVTR